MTARSAERYGRHKVVAILVTFAVGWAAIKLFAPGLEGSFAWFGAWTPKRAFEQRASHVPVRATGVLESRLPDTTLAAGVAVRWRARGADGHPFTWLQDPAVPALRAAAGDTVRARGEYVWDPRGGAVRTGGAKGHTARIRRAGGS